MIVCLLSYLPFSIYPIYTYYVQIFSDVGFVEICKNIRGRKFISVNDVKSNKLKVLRMNHGYFHMNSAALRDLNSADNNSLSTCVYSSRRKLLTAQNRNNFNEGSILVQIQYCAAPLYKPELFFIL